MSGSLDAAVQEALLSQQQQRRQQSQGQAQASDRKRKASCLGSEEGQAGPHCCKRIHQAEELPSTQVSCTPSGL